MTMAKFITIGERIHCISPVIRKAMAERDPAPILQRAKEQYDYVLIDTPPVMPVTDALIVSRFVDGMILVIASAEVKVEMARDVKNQLVNAGANILGVVLNKVRSEHHGYGYGYYYYYGSKEASNGEGK